MSHEVEGHVSIVPKLIVLIAGDAGKEVDERAYCGVGEKRAEQCTPDVAFEIPQEPLFEGKKEEHDHGQCRSFCGERKEPLVPEHGVCWVVSAHKDAGHDEPAKEHFCPVPQKREYYEVYGEVTPKRPRADASAKACKVPAISRSLWLVVEVYHKHPFGLFRFPKIGHHECCEQVFDCKDCGASLDSYGEKDGCVCVQEEDVYERENRADDCGDHAKDGCAFGTSLNHPNRLR